MRALSSAVLLAIGLILSGSTPGFTEEISSNRVGELVQPIALYPDSILQHMLPAATFPDQIADAALLVQNKTDAEQIKEQSWDESVKVIATYPGILKMMYEKLDWTTDLGSAFLDQHEVVLKKIQELRSKAREKGNLKSTGQQTVGTRKSEDGDTYITIEQSDPAVVYIPQETSSTVYTEHVDTASNVLVPVATFGLGMALGSALDDDDDDHYYGGPWGGPMWTSSDSFDDWVDARHDVYEDFRGQSMERQEFRQGQRSERQDFRQDWARDNPEQVNQRRQEIQARQGERSGNLSDQRQNPARQRDSSQPRPERQQAVSAGRQEKLSDARASMKSQGFSEKRGSMSGQGIDRNQVAQRRQTAGGGSASWGGSGGSAFASRASSRGSMSRASMGTGRSLSGGGRPAGGGGMRGGGRGGRR